MGSSFGLAGLSTEMEGDIHSPKAWVTASKMYGTRKITAINLYIQTPQELPPDLNTSLFIFMIMFFNGLLPFPPLGPICVAQNNVRSGLSTMF